MSGVHLPSGDILVRLPPLCKTNAGNVIDLIVASQLAVIITIICLQVYALLHIGGLNPSPGNSLPVKLKVLYKYCKVGAHRLYN